MELAKIIKLSRGEEKADLLLKNARVVNVFSHEIIETNVAIAGDRIMGLGDYQAGETIDLQGRYVCPGFIDGHVHIESSVVTPPEFARAVVPRGTTSVVTDPDEIANVLGIEGVRYMLDSSEGLPLTVFVMAPVVRAGHPSGDLRRRNCSRMILSRCLITLACWAWRR